MQSRTPHPICVKTDEYGASAPNKTGALPVRPDPLEARSVNCRQGHERLVLKLHDHRENASAELSVRVRDDKRVVRDLPHNPEGHGCLIRIRPGSTIHSLPTGDSVWTPKASC